VPLQEEYLSRGWVRFPWDAKIAAWAEHARTAGLEAVKDPAHDQWRDCEGTWFIGVDALPNDVAGRLPGGPELTGAPVDFIASRIGPLPELHKAQLSVIYPGYPRPRAGESEAAFRYRSKRDAAHVDGVKMFSEDRRRRVEEPHAWVLGLPLNDSAPEAAPLVVWEGSHEVMRRAFAQAFDGLPPERWGGADVTEAYTAARKEVFETCKRVTVHARPGEAYLMHRLVLHGVAPWAGAPVDEGRMIAYFRPELTGIMAAWLTTP
jgi:hypothetical protein